MVLLDWTIILFHFRTKASESRNACDPHQLAWRMVAKDLSSPSKCNVKIYNVGWMIAKKTFSNHPDSEIDGHEWSFTTIQLI